MSDRGGVPASAFALLVAVAAIALVVTGAVALTQSLPGGDAVLEDAADRYNDTETLTGGATVVVANETATRSRNVSFAFAAPDGARLTDEDAGVVVGTNGTVAWWYDEANDTARVVEVPDDPHNWSASAGNWTDDQATGNWSARAANWSDRGNASWAGNASWHNATASHGEWPANVTVNVSAYLEENVTATTLRTEEVDGAEAYVVELQHVDESANGTVTLWVDTGDSRVHRAVTERGDTEVTVTFSNQRFDASVHERTFRPPTGASTVTVAASERYDSFDAAQAGTDLALSELGEGYEFQRAVVATRGGVTVTTQEYVGDDTDVAVLATADSLPPETNGTSVTVAGADATYVEREAGGAVYWTDDGATRGVAADLPRERLLELAESLRS